MLLSGEMQVKPIERIDEIDIIGNVNSLTAIDPDKSILELLGEQVGSAIELAKLTADQEVPRAFRASQGRTSLGRVSHLLQRTNSERPSHAASEIRSGLVRNQSLNFGSNTASTLKPKFEDEALKSGSFASRRANFNKKAAKGFEGSSLAKSDSQARSHLSSKGTPPTFERITEQPKKEVEKVQRILATEAQDASKMIERIAAFSPTKRQEQKKEPKRNTVPRRPLRQLSFGSNDSRKMKKIEFEGIGRDKVWERRDRFAKFASAKSELDGRMLQRRNSGRNASVFQESKKKKPSFGSEIGTISEDSSSESSSPEFLKESKLLIPNLLSPAVYFEQFKKHFETNNPIDLGLLELAGIQRKSTISFLEKKLYLEGKMNYRMKTGGEANFTSEEESRGIMSSNRIETYKWGYQDTASLLGQRITKDKTLYQIFNSGKLTNTDVDRVFVCLPVSVGFSLASNEAGPLRFEPYKYTSDDSAVKINTIDDLEHLNDWTEYEMALPCWSGLKVTFDDDAEVEFAQSFTISLDLQMKEDLTQKQKEIIYRFFLLQYKKVLMDSVNLGYKSVVFSFPPQSTLLSIAQYALQEIIEESEMLVYRDTYLYIPTLDIN